MDKTIAITADILTILTSLNEAFVKKVLMRLESSFGYIATENDSWSIAFAIQKVENHIKNYCNTDMVPEGLIETAVDMVVSEFLTTKKSTGQLEMANLDLDGAIKTIREGDTSVEFVQGLSDNEKFDMLLKDMDRGDDLLCYRKLKW